MVLAPPLPLMSRTYYGISEIAAVASVAERRPILCTRRVPVRSILGSDRASSLVSGSLVSCLLTGRWDYMCSTLWVRRHKVWVFESLLGLVCTASRIKDVLCLVRRRAFSYTILRPGVIDARDTRERVLISRGVSLYSRGAHAAAHAVRRQLGRSKVDTTVKERSWAGNSSRIRFICHR
ncbi:unnamed protein product, partial [Ectocarpus fasciculatus]